MIGSATARSITLKSLGTALEPASDFAMLDEQPRQQSAITAIHALTADHMQAPLTIRHRGGPSFMQTVVFIIATPERRRTYRGVKTPAVIEAQRKDYEKECLF